MSLLLQLLSILFSFVFGIFLFLLFKFRKIFNIKKCIISNIINFCLIIILSVLYFLIMYLINGGIIHLYFLLFIIFGFLILYNFFGL